MITTKPKTAIVERHRYVLDWFERDNIELDLEHTVYEFQYRYGPGWYLEAQRYDEKTEKWEPVRWPHGNSFDIANPGAALAALGDHVTKFTCLAPGMQLNKALAKILAHAEQIKTRELMS